MDMAANEEDISISRICAVCSSAITDTAATRCTRCGVPIGDVLEQVISQLDKYDEGCQPRSLHEYDCMCGLDEFHPWKLKENDRNWKSGQRPL